MLTFIHTPKCGGTYVSKILKFLKIPNKGHNQATLKDGTTFTVIRHPVDRFESLLNFRIGLPPTSNKYSETPSILFENLSLDEMVAKMSDETILGFTPYKTLVFWTAGVDHIITIDELPNFLNFFGYTYPKIFEKENVSSKLHGTFNENTRKRIEMLFEEDMKLFNNYKNYHFPISFKCL